jgi:hypothetical protein
VTWAWLEKQFDRYSRTARLYPALLTLAPFLWSGIVLYPSLLSRPASSTGFLVAVGSSLYFLASVARSRGKFAEAKLLKKWGGWPTTLFLRHRDPTIDKITKARYHTALSKLCDGLAFPLAEEEARAPVDADEVYRSATKKLIELRRGKQYELIHAENASYGFRRNLYGLKPVAVAFALLAAVVTAGAWWVVVPTPLDWSAVIKSVIDYPHLPLLIMADLGYIALWLWAIGEPFVYQAAREYAEALLRTLD